MQQHNQFAQENKNLYFKDRGTPQPQLSASSSGNIEVDFVVRNVFAKANELENKYTDYQMFNSGGQSSSKQPAAHSALLYNSREYQSAPNNQNFRQGASANDSADIILQRKKQYLDEKLSPARTHILTEQEKSLGKSPSIVKNTVNLLCRELCDNLDTAQNHCIQILAQKQNEIFQISTRQKLPSSFRNETLGLWCDAKSQVAQCFEDLRDRVFYQQQQAEHQLGISYLQNGVYSLRQVVDQSQSKILNELASFEQATNKNIKLVENIQSHFDSTEQSLNNDKLKVVQLIEEISQKLQIHEDPNQKTVNRLDRYLSPFQKKLQGYQAPNAALSKSVLSSQTKQRGSSSKLSQPKSNQKVFSSYIKPQSTVNSSETMNISHEKNSNRVTTQEATALIERLKLFYEQIQSSEQMQSTIKVDLFHVVQTVLQQGTLHVQKMYPLAQTKPAPQTVDSSQKISELLQNNEQLYSELRQCNEKHQDLRVENVNLREQILHLQQVIQKPKSPTAAATDTFKKVSSELCDLVTKFMHSMRQLQKAVNRKEIDVSQQKSDFEQSKIQLQQRVHDVNEMLKSNTNVQLQTRVAVPNSAPARRSPSRDKVKPTVSSSQLSKLPALLQNVQNLKLEKQKLQELILELKQVHQIEREKLEKKLAVKSETLQKYAAQCQTYQLKQSCFDQLLIEIKRELLSKQPNLVEHIAKTEEQFEAKLSTELRNIAPNLKIDPQTTALREELVHMVKSQTINLEGKVEHLVQQLKIKEDSLARLKLLFIQKLHELENSFADITATVAEVDLQQQQQAQQKLTYQTSHMEQAVETVLAKFEQDERERDIENLVQANNSLQSLNQQMKQTQNSSVDKASAEAQFEFVVELQEQLDKCKEELEKMQNLKKEFEVQEQGLKKEIQTLKYDNKRQSFDLKDAKDRLEKCKSEYQAQFNGLKSTVIGQKQHIDKELELKQQLEVKVTNLKKEYVVAIQNAKDAEEQRAQIETELMQERLDLNEWRSMVQEDQERLNQEINQLTAQLAEGDRLLKGHQDQSLNEVTELNQKLAEASESIQQYREELDSTKAELAQTVLELEAMSQNLNEMTENLDEMTANLENKTSEAIQIQQELTQQIRDLQNKYELDLEPQLTSDMLDRHISLLKSGIQIELPQNVKFLHKLVASQQAMFTLLQQQFIKSEQEQQENEVLLKDLKEELKQLAQESLENQVKLNEQQRKAEQREGQALDAAKLQSEVQEAQALLDFKMKEVESLTLKLGRCSNELADTNTKLTQILADQKLLQDDKNSVEQLFQMNQQILQQNELTNTQLKNENQRQQASIISLQEQLQQNLQMVENMKEKIEYKSLELSQFLQNNEAIQKQWQNQEESLSEALKKVSKELRLVISLTNCSNAHLKSANAKSDLERSQLASELSIAMANFVEHKTSFVELNSEYRECQKELSDAISQIDVLTKQVAAQTQQSLVENTLQEQLQQQIKLLSEENQIKIQKLKEEIQEGKDFNLKLVSQMSNIQSEAESAYRQLMDDMKTQVLQARNESETLGIFKKNLEVELQTVRTDLVSKTTLVEGLYIQLAEQKTSLEASNNELSEQNLDLKSSLEKSQKELKLLKNLLSSQRYHYQLKISQFSQSLTQLQQELEDLNKRLEQNLGMNSELRLTVDTQRSEMSLAEQQYQHELDQLNSQIQALKNNYSEITSKVEQQTEQLQSSEQIIECLRSEIQKLKQIMEQGSHEQAKLVKQHEETLSLNAKLNEIISSSGTDRNMESARLQNQISQLEQQLIDLTSEHQQTETAFQKQISQLIQEDQNTQVVIQKLQQDNQDLKLMIESSNQINDKLAKEAYENKEAHQKILKQFEDYIKSHKQKGQDSEQEKTQLLFKIKSLEDEVENHVATNTKLASDKQQLQQQLTHSQQGMTLQEAVHAEQVTALQAQERMSEEQLSLALNAHKQEVLELKAQQENSLKTLHIDYFDQIKAIQQSNEELISKLQVQISDLTLQKEELDSKLQQKQENYANKVAEATRLQQINDSEQVQLVKIIKEHASEVTSLTDQISDLNQKLKNLADHNEFQVSELNLKLRTQQDQISADQTQLETQQQQIQLLSSQSGQEVEQLNKQIQQSQEKISQLMKDVSLQTSLTDKLQKQLTASETDHAETVSRLTNKLADVEKDCAEEAKQLNSQIQLAENKLSQQKSESAQHVNSLQGALEALKESGSKETSRLTEIIESLNAKLQSNADEHVNQLSKLNQQIEAIQCDHQKQVDSLQNDLNGFKAKLEQSHKNDVENKKIINGLNSTIEQLQSSIRKITSEHKDQLEALQTQISGNLQNNSALVQDLQNKESKAQKALDELNNKNQENERMVLELNNEIQSLKEKNQNFKSDSDQEKTKLLQKITSLEDEVENHVATNKNLALDKQQLQQQLNLFQQSMTLQKAVHSELVTALQAREKMSEEQLSLALNAHKQEVQELKAQQENSLHTLQIDHDDQVQAIQQSNQELVRKLQAQVTDLSKESQSLKEQLEQQKQIAEARVEQQTKIVYDFQNKIEQLEQNSDVKIREFTAKLGEQEHGYIQKLADQEISFKKIVQTQLEKVNLQEIEIQQLNDRNKSLISEMDQLQSSKETDLLTKMRLVIALHEHFQKLLTSKLLGKTDEIENLHIFTQTLEENARNSEFRYIQLEGDLKTSNDMVEKLKLKLKQQQGETDAKIDSLETQITSLQLTDQLNEQLQEKISQLQAELLQSQGLLHLKEQQLELILSPSNANGEQHQSLFKLQQTNQELEKQLERQNETLFELKADNQRLKQAQTSEKQVESGRNSWGSDGGHHARGSWGSSGPSTSNEVEEHLKHIRSIMIQFLSKLPHTTKENEDILPILFSMLNFSNDEINSVNKAREELNKQIASSAAKAKTNSSISSFFTKKK